MLITLKGLKDSLNKKNSHEKLLRGKVNEDCCIIPNPQIIYSLGFCCLQVTVV